MFVSFVCVGVCVGVCGGGVCGGCKGCTEKILPPINLPNTWEKFHNLGAFILSSVVIVPSSGFIKACSYQLSSVNRSSCMCVECRLHIYCPYRQ